MGIAKCYIGEALEIAARYGYAPENVSVLKAACTIPYPDQEIREMLSHCSTIVIAEELEPYMEREVYVQAHTMGAPVKIIGKLDGVLSRLGSFNAIHVAKAICAAGGVELPEDLLTYGAEARQKHCRGRSPAARAAPTAVPIWRS